MARATKNFISGGLLGSEPQMTGLCRHRLDVAQWRGTMTHATRSAPMLHPSRGGGGGRPHEGHAQAQLELQGRHPEARPASSSTEVGMRLPPKMTLAQIAEAQRMTREWKRLGAPGKSRSQVRVGRTCGSTGRVFCSAYGARWRSL